MRRPVRLAVRLTVLVPIIAVLTVVHTPPAFAVGNNCLPDGWWVGFNQGNTDVNLFYAASGSIELSNGCMAADQPLELPETSSEHGVPLVLAIPPDTVATLNDSLWVGGGEDFYLECPGGLYPDWKTCSGSDPPGVLDDNGYDITVSGGFMAVAPGSTLSLSRAAIYVRDAGEFRRRSRHNRLSRRLSSARRLDWNRL